MPPQPSTLALLEQTFALSDQQGFENVLYAAIKSAAYSTCLPKVATAEDAAASLSSQSINETSSEAELVEYNRLLETIFADFETFLANANFADLGNDFGDTSLPESQPVLVAEGNKNNVLDRLIKKLSVVCPKLRTPCGRIFEEQEPTFRCKDCSTDATCAFCRTCFFASIHANHRYKMHASGGGYCDCGDEEAWTSGAWCRIHAGDGDKDVERCEDSTLGLSVFRSVAEEQNFEMERVQSLLSKLPIDLVRRCAYLLQPLINSASLVLFGLLQGSASIDCLPLSTIPNNTNEMDREFDKPIAEDNWPPALSHLSNTSIEWDANRLDLRVFPRTCPQVCDVESMELRCLNQLARAHYLHPALFDVVASSAAKAASMTSNEQYIVVLYNNEFHNYEDVIRIVRRVDGCTSKQATLFAIVVNRDGRTPLLTNLALRLAAQKAARVSLCPGARHMIRPLRAAAMEQGIYAMENFFISALRWLERLATQVLPLRPLVCNALLGRFPSITDTSNSIPHILPPSDMMVPNSLLWNIIHRLTLCHRGVRKTASRLIASVLLQEPYHRRIFAIEFTRFYDVISQSYAYDDHLKADTLLSMTCQFYTVTSLARHLLTESDALAHLISRLVLSILDNSEPLPGIYDARRGYRTLFSQFCGDGFNSPASMPVLMATRIRALRRVNAKAWEKAKEAIEAVNRGRANEDLMTFHWRRSPIELAAFNPFERLFHTTCDDLHYLLNSLLNVRPLPGWWETKARTNFLCFFRQFLRLLCCTQDMNGLLRATETHVEVEQEWISTFKTLSHLHRNLQLVVQVASSDKQLLLGAIKATVEVFERRIGIIDRCFYLGEWDGPYSSAQDIDGIKAQCLGATSAVYEYDILSLRFSVMQPIPRLLAALFGHALEMGLSLTRIGLNDKEFANLVIERPLQNIAFIAQCSANLWVRNGQMIRNIVYNMHEGLRAEIVDRDYQLIQQAAAVTPADELIVRLIHKLGLLDFMNEDQAYAKSGHVQLLETFLRTLLYLVTHRTTEGVGYFDPKVYALMPSSTTLFPDANLGEVDEALEVNYGQLIEDVIHILCIKPMTHSKLLSSLPPRSPGCLLRKAPPYPQHEKSASSSHSTSWGSRRDSIDEPLSKLLQQFTDLITRGTKRVYAIKPEVIVNRFNRFYHGYKHSEQTTAEEYVSRVVKQWSQKSVNPIAIRCQQLPLPPPPPRPRRRFVPTMEKGLLQIVRCTTFVRLIRCLLDVALVHNSTQSWWSETLTELILHLIIVAIYEDAIAFAETGRRPFMESVVCVPIEKETLEELQRLAASRHWINSEAKMEPISGLSYENNCITFRLGELQKGRVDPQVSQLAKWTMDLWHMMSKSQVDVSACSTAMEVDSLGCEESKKLQILEVKQRRRARIMAQMSKMQQKFIETHFMEISGANGADQQMETADVPSLNCNNQLSFDEAVGNTAFGALDQNHLEKRISRMLTKKKSLVTCVLCLDEVPEEEGHQMVVVAYASRSNVLSIPVPQCQAVDFPIGACQPNCTEETLSGIATTAVAASIGSHEVVLTQLPYLLNGLTSSAQADLTEGAHCIQSLSSMEEDGQPSSSTPAPGLLTKNLDALDPWFQRPLISSRCPVGEEGTFISTCLHFMHAACKERYAERLKEQNDNMRHHRYAHRLPMYEFRCSLCRSLANFDFPVVEHIYDSMPIEWLSGCLQRPADLSSWFRNFHKWLNESPKLPTSINFKMNFSITELSNVPESFSLLFGVLTDCNAENRDQILEQICENGERAFSQMDTDKINKDDAENGLKATTPDEAATVSLTSEHRSRLHRLFGSSSSSQEARTTPCPEQRAVVPLLQFPRPDHFRVSENLWTFVKSLVHLSQPRPIECVQPPITNAEGNVPVNFIFINTAVVPPEADIDEGGEDNGDNVNNNLLDNDTINTILNDFGADTSEVNVTSLIMQAIVADASRSLDEGDRQRTTSGSNAAAASLPPCVCEAVEELHTSLVSCYSHLLFLNDRLKVMGAKSDRLPNQTVSRLRAALICSRRRNLQALLAAASAWRTFRHSVAYTLINWERYLRLLGPRSHFFSNDLTERHKTGLCYLIRAAFHAHARLAPVSRGVFGCNEGDTSGMRQWFLQRDDPEWWWWYCYFAPQTYGSTEAFCSHNHTKLASHLSETVTRIAVTQDALRLWRLLLPDSGSLCDNKPTASSSSSLSACPSLSTLNATLPLDPNPQTPDALGIPASLLWEADITHLFISLLFLRPGLEGVDWRVMCQRTQLRERASKMEATGQLPDVACHEGFPRLPVGDSHEVFTVRLCYLALLVQTLLSWQPQRRLDGLVDNALQEPCVTLWMNEKLLAVRRRLQHLSNIPVCMDEPTSQNLTHLFAYIYSRCLPFLRIAAFIISQVTNHDPPVELSDSSEDKPSCEFSVLLAYLGLPQSPSYLLVLLSDASSSSEDTVSPPSLSVKASASGSLWLTSLMTSWCFLGRGSVSRSLYTNQLLPTYLPSSLELKLALPLLPEPTVDPPHLIQLPKDYVSLMALATELKSVHTGSNIHSDPSLCLVCGAVACFACYSCRRFETIPEMSSSSENTPLNTVGRREAVVYDIQAHVRRYHAGYALVMLFTGGVLLFSDQGRRTTELTSPYRDEFGEPDVGIRRGNPLFLDEKAYEELNRIWFNHQMNSTTSAKLYLI